MGLWQEEEARPSQEADSPTPSLVRLATSLVHLRMADSPVTQISAPIDPDHQKRSAWSRWHSSVALCA